MPEPARGRVCARCGQENPVGATRCAECGEAFGGAVLLSEQEPRTSYAGPWWQSESQTEGEERVSAEERIIPLPPQLRAEQEREQRVAEERQRWAEERQRSEAAGRAARQAAYEQALRRRERAQQRLEQRMRELADAEAAVYNTTEAPEQYIQETPMYGPQVTVRSVEETTPVTHVTQVAPVSEVEETVRPGMTNPVVAAVSSALVPGLGQFMNGQSIKALLLLLGFMVATFIFSQSPVGLLVMVGRILAAVDAYRIATRRRAGKNIRDGEWDLG